MAPEPLNRHLERADTVTTLTDHKDIKMHIQHFYFFGVFFSRRRENAMFIPGLESISLSGEGQELCYPEAGTQTHLSTTGRVDSRLPSGLFPKQSNIPRGGKSCAAYLHKVFRKLLCYFGGLNQ